MTDVMLIVRIILSCTEAVGIQGYRDAHCAIERLGEVQSKYRIIYTVSYGQSGAQQARQRQRAEGIGQ